jgi:S-adenosylmethionine-diacylglycerol 3-amino-3-carboxypropyl transferase
MGRVAPSLQQGWFMQLRSTVKDRPVFQRIVYSQCWEDPAVAAEGLALGPQDDLLCLSSAGCNVLALSLSEPRSILAIDFSAAQNALLELKIAALRALSWPEYVAFLGARPSTERLTWYRNRVRRELGDGARAYWDASECQADLAAGIIHQGRFQRYLSLFRRRLLPLIHRKGTVEALFSLDDLPAQRRFYDERWNNRRWRALFTVFFGRAVMARLGRDPAFFRYVDRADIGAEFLRRAEWALTQTSLRHNHFAQYALLGEYPDLAHAPLYLREEHFETLRETSARIRIEQGDLESHLSRLEPGALSKLYLSDLFEWVSAEHHETMLRAIARVTRPDGRLVYWNLLVPRQRPESLAEVIEVHPETSRALHQRDLAFVYGSFHVESVRDPAGAEAAAEAAAEGYKPYCTVSAS